MTHACSSWLCAHPIASHTDARGCTVAGCLCHYTAREAGRSSSVSLASVAWRNLYVVATGKGRVLVADTDSDLRAEEGGDG